MDDLSTGLSVLSVAWRIDERRCFLLTQRLLSYTPHHHPDTPQVRYLAERIFGRWLLPLSPSAYLAKGAR